MFHDHDKELLLEIRDMIREVLRLLRYLVPQSTPPVALAILQGGSSVITGTPAGGSSTFQESYIPSNAALPPGAVLSVTWTCDDPNAVLAPSADGTSVVVTIPVTDTQGSAPAGSPGSYNLTATGTSAALPAPITSGPVNVPILPTPPPLPTALAVNQTA